jgi:hypothetical protein
VRILKRLKPNLFVSSKVNPLLLENRSIKIKRNRKSSRRSRHHTSTKCATDSDAFTGPNWLRI